MDASLGTEPIEGVAAGRLVFRLVLHIDGEAVGELGPVIGEDDANGMREVGEEALQEPSRGVGIPLGMDFQINVTRGAIDGDEGVAFAPLQRRQMLEINMNEPDGGLLEDAYRRLVRFGAMAQAVALEAAMDGAARELVINTTSHHLDDIVERQLQFSSQFTDQCFFHWREAGLQCPWGVRIVAHRSAATPSADRGLADSEFGRQIRNPPFATLDVGSDLRGRGGVGVQVQFHDARRSLT